MVHEGQSMPGDEPAEYLIKHEEPTNDEFGYYPDKRPIDLHIDCGIVNIDKPTGPTSHEVSAWVKKILQIQRAGHAGTLDPSVTGVLPVGLGRATRVVNCVHTAGKEYVCILRLHKIVGYDRVMKTVNMFIGKIYQRPPLMSNVKRVLRIREIHYINIIEVKDNYIMFRVGCESGTYIRKLCHDIGEALYCGGQMDDLRRTRTGFFFEDHTLSTLQDLKDAFKIYKEERDERYLRAIISPMEKAVYHWKKIIIRDSAVDAIAHGANLSVTGVLRINNKIEKNDEIAILTQKGELVAVGTATMSAYRMIELNTSWCATTDRVFMDRNVYPKWKK
jgi:H/ACA ribonucleoprotein complex subunit 4